MKILLTRKPAGDGKYVSEIKEADEYTIMHEPIASIDLMERASRMFVNQFIRRFPRTYKKVIVLCGQGDNGGDGLVIARMLYELGYELDVFVVDYSPMPSASFRTNLSRLANKVTVNYIRTETETPEFHPGYLFIDAILGAGLSRPLGGLIKTVVERLNAIHAEVVAVDIPTGLFADTLHAPDDVIMEASHTFTFQMPKLAFFLPCNARFVGDWLVIDIGLHEGFIDSIASKYEYTDATAAGKLIKPRAKFANKGNFGHALMIAGSYGMIGAAVLSTRACLRSGVGKVTVYAPGCGYEILQAAVPEAMCLSTENDRFLDGLPALDNYQAIGIGCGIGTRPQTATMVEALLKNVKVPLVIDADALNVLAETPERLAILPEGTVLTPHPKEFQRLIGRQWENDYEKLEILSAFAQKHRCIVCLKGAFTAVALPDGKIHFNATGNPGMAKGGSGDVLTGVILALLAQGYSAAEAAILGVFEHGLAGDKAAGIKGTTAMIASDIIEQIRF